MNLPKIKSGKTKPKQYIDQNPIEALMSIGTGMRDSMVDELGKQSLYDARDQILNADHQPKERQKGGDLTQGQELNLSEAKDQIVRLTEMGEDFTKEILHAGKQAANENSREVLVKIQEILIEIKQLSESSKELKDQVDIIAVEQIGENLGKYHLTFIEEVLANLRDARLKVEDGLAWFKALTSKKAARQYGVMAKKGGTSFTLSNERVVATQTG